MSAQLSAPLSVAVDEGGSLYISDGGNNRVRKVAPNGTIATVAGNGQNGESGDGGPAISAKLKAGKAAVDAYGDLYIAGACKVRKVAWTGTISTVAGTGECGYSGDRGLATSAQLADVWDVALDAAGNLYIADGHSHTVRKVARNGIISTVAGNGENGYSGDGGLATSAQISVPSGLALDAGGNLYIADWGRSVVRKVSPDGVITTFAGTGQYGYSGEGGPAASARLTLPTGVAVARDGSVYVADNYSNAVRKVAPNGIITTVAGNGASGNSGDGGPALWASLSSPGAVAVDAAGNLYVADTDDFTVRKVTPDGTITAVAGNGTGGHSGDGGPATAAQLGGGLAIALDAAGNLYIADTYNNAVRRVAPGGIITAVAGNGSCYNPGDGAPAASAGLEPQAVAVDSAGNMFIADWCLNKIREVSAEGAITTVAGNGLVGYSGDAGPAIAAELNHPRGIAVDSAGNLYIADTDNNAVRMVANGTITTLFSVAWPQAVAVDAAGNLFVSTSVNVIRRASNGTVTNIAGNGQGGYSGDGGPALSASFWTIAGLAVDLAGNIYLADTLNDVIRMLAPQGAHAVLGISSTDPGVFDPGQTGAGFPVVVSNAAGAGPTVGTVTVKATVSLGLTLVSLSGPGWSCSAGTCARNDVLGAGSSYPPITLTVNVAPDAPSQVMTEIAVSGGSGETVFALQPHVLRSFLAPALISPANGVTGVVSPILNWSESIGADFYDVYFGPSSSPPLVTTTTGTSYSPEALSPATTYYWQVVARNTSISLTSPMWSFTTSPGPRAPLRFVAVAPCRVVDTRRPAGPFGGQALEGDSSRSFAIPQGACGIPGTAQAYSLNVTAVPNGPLGFLTLWPTGQAQPRVSTLNSWDGDVVANAAIVPAGAGGAVSVYVTSRADVILDINGYFDASAGAAFYTAPPCRVVDTRRPADLLGGPSLVGGRSRDFPVPYSPCGIPPGAGAYAMNVTALPAQTLGFLTVWPTGEERPFVSTLNSWAGQPVANAAIVQAGSNGSVSVYVTDAAGVILDASGYFAAPGNPGALSFYPVTPCRVGDTRNPDTPFGGPILEAGTTRTFAIPASACYAPSSAAAYALNITVVPDGPLPYLTAWPAAAAQPFVSTLNSWDGTVVANAAIVPAGEAGAISVFVTGRTHVIVDMNGYFAP